MPLKRLPQAILMLAILPIAGCAQTRTADLDALQGEPDMPSGMLIVNLASDAHDPAFAALRHAFVRRNPGYDIQYEPAATSLAGDPTTRIVFIQRGSGSMSLSPDGHQSDVDVGDIVLMRPGERAPMDTEIDCLIFTSPEPLPEHLPAFIRPDWDENITDTVGGCATETGAYRRILLTWLEQNGSYVYHALNAHRVRITDSFTHYHPLQGGFDEFYLVQMVQPNARIITSDRVDLIEDPQTIDVETARSLLTETKLRVGDLVYLPRGVAHRGIDGVLAQVIAAPGFRPGAEIGLDHYLLAINKRLGLAGQGALPYNVAASASVIVK